MAQYVITDGTRYIMQNAKHQYVPISNEALADHYDKRIAENILGNMLTKGLRKTFRIQKVDAPPKLVKQIQQHDLTKTEKVMETSNVQRWIDRVSDLNGLAEEMTQRRDELSENLKKLDNATIDILHYCEFSTLNAAQGCEFYKRCRSHLKKRRSIKNELTVLDTILSKKIGETVGEEVSKQVSGMDNRYYRPKEMKELFDL